MPVLFHKEASRASFRLFSWAMSFVGHNYIGTEHILLGMLREGEGVAARVLETLGADSAKIRTQVRSCLATLSWLFFYV